MVENLDSWIIGHVARFNYDGTVQVSTAPVLDWAPISPIRFESYSTLPNGNPNDNVHLHGLRIDGAAASITLGEEVLTEGMIKFLREMIARHPRLL